MSDIEKIMCVDHGCNNDSALTAALMNRNNDNWMNNPFAYMMMMALFRNGGFGFDGNGAGANNNALEAIRTQMAENQNSTLLMDAISNGFGRNELALSQLSQNLNVDFNTLQKCCCDVQSAIQQVGGQVGFSAERVINAANLGDCNIIQALKDCCCSTQRQIADFRGDVMLQNCKDTGELRNGQRDLGNAITQGFAQTAFQAQQDKCDIIRANQDNTQRVIDTMNNHWKEELAKENQDLKTKLALKEQTEALIAARYGNGCGFGFNNGCGNGCGC